MSEEEEKAALKKDQGRRAALQQDYIRTFQSEHGKRVLLDLMKRHYVLEAINSTVALELAHVEGARSVVLRIMNAMTTDPEKLANLIREAKTDVR